MISPRTVFCAALTLATTVVGCGQTNHAPLASAATAASDQAAAAKELLELGLELAREGDAVRGEQYLVSALDAGADANAALLPLLKLCIKSGRFEAAAQYAEAYGKDVAAKRDLDLLLGGLYVTLDERDKAVLHLQRVTRRYPEHAMAHLLLARVLQQQSRDLQQADEQFRAYLRLAPEGPFAAEARESLLTRVDETESLPVLSPPGTAQP
jgi:Tfp pilus assembly protein PilF